MNLLSPRSVLRQVAEALPADCCSAVIIIIGSLAAGYRYFRDNPEALVQTKDVDCMLSPHIKAVPAGKAVAESLFRANWRMREDGQWGSPGTADTPVEQLPLVRLHPPGSSEWFIELMVSPPASGVGKQFVRLETALGHFGLCGFGYLSLVEVEPIMTEYGIAIARPEMMALANLLHHPVIGPETMSGLIGARQMKRSNKDLGRVLALAFLAMREDEEALRGWPEMWASALRQRFPGERRKLCAVAGQGLRQLIGSPGDMEEAAYGCANGLLASYRLTAAQLRIAGLRLVQDAVEPLEGMGKA